MSKKIHFRGQMSPVMTAIRMGPEVMRISIDVPLTERENALPLLALLDQPLVFDVGVDNSPASTRIERSENGKKEPSGPYAEFWRIMVIKGVKTYPDLQELLDCTPEHVWESLHAAFETATMSTVSPRQWEAWVTENGLNEGLITMSRNAEIQAAKAGTN